MSSHSHFSSLYACFSANIHTEIDESFSCLCPLKCFHLLFPDRGSEQAVGEMMGWVGGRRSISSKSFHLTTAWRISEVCHRDLWPLRRSFLLPPLSKAGFLVASGNFNLLISWRVQHCLLHSQDCPWLSLSSGSTATWRNDEFSSNGF